MKLKRREKKQSGLELKRKKDKLKLKRRPPRERRTKAGHFIIEDKHWEDRLVPCCNCRHYLESNQLYIGPNGEQGWMCSITGLPNPRNRLLIKGRR